MLNPVGARGMLTQATTGLSEHLSPVVEIMSIRISDLENACDSFLWAPTLFLWPKNTKIDVSVGNLRKWPCTVDPRGFPTKTTNFVGKVFWAPFQHKLNRYMLGLCSYGFLWPRPSHNHHRKGVDTPLFIRLVGALLTGANLVHQFWKSSRLVLHETRSLKGRS
jgi:hypothetical protein